MTEAPLSAPPARCSRVAAAAAQAPQPLVRVVLPRAHGPTQGLPDAASAAKRLRALCPDKGSRLTDVVQAEDSVTDGLRHRAHRRCIEGARPLGPNGRATGGAASCRGLTRYRGVRQLKRAAGCTPTCSWPRALTLRLVRSASGTIARARRSALTLLLTRSLYLSLSHLRARRSALIPLFGRSAGY